MSLLLKLCKQSAPSAMRSQVRAFASSGGIPDLKDAAVGREKEELECEEEGFELFPRDPIFTTEADGNTKESPILVPSCEEERVVGVAHNDANYIMWFNCHKGPVHYVPEVEKYFKLYNPMEKQE